MMHNVAMVEIKAKVRAPKAAYGIKTSGSLPLTFEQRTKGRTQARLDSGEEVALALPAGEVLRAGDLVTASDGRVIEVLAREESLLHAEASGAGQLARAAYRLGSAHVPLQVGEGWLRVPADPMMEKGLKEFGLRVTPVEAPFEAELAQAAAAHGHAHAHEHCDHGHDHASHRHGHDHE